ncbi:MAG: adaptor protein MecA, partial [Clostridiaceae bacterium]|nr:adaptor protein MecA [Clostridiaceae bacterium]
MKFERINDNIIKITVSLSDLAERNIDLQSLTYNS